APFGQLQALPAKGKAVTTWGNQDEAFADIARGIREAVMSLEQASREPQPVFNVPHPRNEFFQGREDGIADLRTQLTRQRKAALAQAQAITGLGGIGKTQTAVEYAYRYRDEYSAVVWLNAESALSLKTACGELARELRLPHPENDLDAAVLAFKHWLKRET